MGLGNILILSQVTLLVLSFILCFFYFIPMIINRNEFQENCLLGAEGEWIGTGSETALRITKWGNGGNCSFAIIIGVAVFPISLFYILWMAVYLFKGTEPSWISAFFNLIVSIVICLMLFIEAIVLTSGFRSWCDLVSKRLVCEDAPFTPFLEDKKHIYTRNFYVELGMTQFGLWCSWILWLLLSVLGAVQLYRYHTQENFFTSLHRERERLLQHISPTGATSYSV